MSTDPEIDTPPVAAPHDAAPGRNGQDGATSAGSASVAEVLRSGEPDARRGAEKTVDHARIEVAVREILYAIGEDPDRDGLKHTPARVARMYAEICAGMFEDPAAHLQTMFEADHDEMVLVRDIPLYSICEHHLVAFHGRAHVAYIPNDDGRVTGLSKMARLVDAYARRPQVQERLTAQVADELERTLNPKGCMVVIEAEHLCMSMRGVKKPGSTTVTSAVRGIFRRNQATRDEAMRFIFGR